MNPLGLAWEEITASSLVTVDFKGNIIRAPRKISLAKSPRI
jgi:ribulose-5-phosphate 4-epimerase/fuculose-1-phosphate aldolase